MVAWPPQTVPNLHLSPPCDCPANYSARRRRVDLLRLMVTLLTPLGALECPAQELQSGALVHDVALTMASGKTGGFCGLCGTKGLGPGKTLCDTDE